MERWRKPPQPDAAATVCNWLSHLGLVLYQLPER